ncbi:MAG: hypothetical protein M3P33_03200 [bacterium]|nr:hypothetical protein [bacterium]
MVYYCSDYMKLNFATIYILCCFLFVGFFSWRYIHIVMPAHEANPVAYNFFPFNESGAEYTITKSDKLYSLNYAKYGFEKTCATCDDNRALLIGSTPVDLEQFVNKKVSVHGSFIEVSPYCKGDCKFNDTLKRPVVKIDSIQLAE